jgi:peptidyl-prolyl cis-trans isomerase SurA
MPAPSRPSSEVVRGAQAAEVPAKGDGPPVPPSIPPDPSDAIDRVTAVVNQDVITLSELQERVVEYLQQTKGDPTPERDRTLREKLLQGLVEHRLKFQEAEREKIVVEDAEITEQLDEMMKRVKATTPEEFEVIVKAQGLTVDDVKKRVREQLMVQKVTRRKVVLRISVTEQEVERYLSDNRDKLETGLSFHARHILFVPNSGGGEAAWELARARAEEVWAKLRAGEDFAELAKRYSQDSTANDGGDLGALKRGELAPEIEEPILRLKPGETSGPIKTSLGYHLFKLESRESFTGDALTQAREQIRDILFRQKYQVRLETWLEELKRRAIIEVRP